LRFVTCKHGIHAGAILDILNEAILHSTALYDYKPRSPDSMSGWFKAKEAASFPVLGAVDSCDRLLGFASYGAFRAWPAYNRYKSPSPSSTCRPRPKKTSRTTTGKGN
jgi:L-amino acid N-acyltransferase